MSANILKTLAAVAIILAAACQSEAQDQAGKAGTIGISNQDTSNPIEQTSCSAKGKRGKGGKRGGKRGMR